MNEHIRPPSGRPASYADTDSATGSRRCFTADEFERMARAGILDHDERLELIAGDIYTLSPKGRRHEVLRSELLMDWIKRASPYKIASETPLRLSDLTEPVPDLIVYPAHLVAPDVRADTVLLVVEISESSLRFDLKRKAAVYAEHGVAEYWVINARDIVTRVHREPSPEGYRAVTDVPGSETVTPLTAPELAISMKTIDS